MPAAPREERELPSRSQGRRSTAAEPPRGRGQDRMTLMDRLAPTLVAVLAVAFTLHRLEDFDTWYHLAAGRLMVETGRWPAGNTFALTAPDHPWIDLHWLFQLLLYGAWALGGIAGCILFAAVLVATTSLVLYGLARRFVPPALAAFLMAVALAISCPRFVPRPELLSFLYFAVYLVLLESYPRNGRAIFLLIPLQILWTNTQGIFAVGLALMGCYWVGATLAFLPVPRGWKTVTGLAPAEWRRLTVVIALATLGCLLNPWGVTGALFPVQLLPRVTGNSLFSDRIGEFRPPLQSGYAPPLVYTWIALLVVSGLSFLLDPGRWHLGRLLAVAAFGFLSTQSLRNMAFFGFLAAPAIAANVGPWLARRRLPARVGTALAAASVASIVLLTGAVATNQFSRVMAIQREFGLGVSRARFPEGAVAFLERAGISGRAFNCLAMGGYLTWSRSRDAVFIDGRLEAFPEQIFRDYFRAMDEPAAWPRLVGGYDLDYALLYHGWSNRFPLVTYLSKDNGWTMVYYDEIASVFVRDDAAHAEVRTRAQRVFADVQRERQQAGAAPVPSSLARVLAVPVAESWRQSAFGNFLRHMGYQSEAATAYERSLALDPGQIDARFALGFAYWYSNRPDAAKREWRELLRRDPGNARVQQVLARAEQGG
jgi:hypothetical protein